MIMSEQQPGLFPTSRLNAARQSKLWMKCQ